MTDAPTQHESSPGSRLTAIAGGLIVALGGLVGAGAGVLSATGGDWNRPDTFVVFFALCSTVAGLLGALVVLGAIRRTVGMTLLIASGMLLVGGALSEPQLIAGVLGQEGGAFRAYHGVQLRTLMLAQLVASALGFLLCAMQVWSRDPSKTIPLVVRAAVFLGLLGAIGAFAAVPSLRDMITSAPRMVAVIAVVLGGLLGIVFTAAGGHTLIRSFEVTRDS